MAVETPECRGRIVMVRREAAGMIGLGMVGRRWASNAQAR